MSWAERTRQGVEDWFTRATDPDKPSWSDRIGKWLLDRISGGVKDFLEKDEPAAIENVQDIISRLRKNPNTSPEVLALLGRIEKGGSWFMIVIAIMMAVQTIVSTVSTLWAPTQKQISYTEERAAKTFRFDPLSVITAWRRDPAANVGLFDDLRDLGWSEARIESLKFITEFLPNADEQTLWLAREVFEPKMIDKYGLDDELPNYAETDFAKIGVTPEQMTNKWRAHWEHASWIQIVEMLHRGLLAEEDVYEWFRLVEIAPHWRDLLIQTAYAWPTRVDVRRWWDMRTIDETELRRLYAGMGYKGVNLDNYVIWTKVYTEFPSLLARWSKGWITTAELRAETIALGMPAERVETFIQEKMEAEKSERTVKERDITKTDIYKGVKQERISRDQGIELLQDLGYDEDEADYLLAINIPEDNVASVVKDRLLTKSDIISGLRSGVLEEAEARDRLSGLRYSAVDVQLLLDIFNASIKPPTEPREREASKADIVKAVKKGLIDPEEGYLMLTDIGFEPSAADFILFVNVEESPFSPVNMEEFKDITAKLRRAAAMTTPAFDNKLREAADELVRISDQVKLLEDQVREERVQIQDQEVIPDEAKARLKEIQVALNRALAEKSRLQNAYDTLAAEFRQTPE